MQILTPTAILSQPRTVLQFAITFRRYFAFPLRNTIATAYLQCACTRNGTKAVAYKGADWLCSLQAYNCES